jgi:ribulose-5-phosphate 4-epimerase/fuculose-1-phosphate aldolase
MSTTAEDIILNAGNYFEQVSSGYKTWGHVKVVQVAVRTGKQSYICSIPGKPIETWSHEDVLSKATTSSDLLGRIFAKRKDVQVILLTEQEYAAQVKETIPPILDDQAQLLGVTVRVAKGIDDITHALSGRFAAVMVNGRSICVGANLEDAYVAAQLLEKTSKAFIEAKALGGVKSINKIEAWLMQKFYQLKYSKEASKNK